MKKKILIPIIVCAVVVVSIGGFFSYKAIAKEQHQKQIAAQKAATEKEQQAQAKAKAQAEQNAENAKMDKFKENKGYYASSTLGYINPYNSSFNPDEIVPGENIIKSAEPYAVPANEVAQMIAGTYKGTQKEVFLTFDDGPSANNTPQILNILKQEGVPATFFVIGDQIRSNPQTQQIIRDEIMDGNAIGDHTFTHVYSQLYPNNQIDVPYFMDQVKETQDLLTDLLGPNFHTGIVRLPGGYMSRAVYNDPNLVAFNKALDAAHDTALDWTAETGDASTSAVLTESQLINIMNSNIQQQTDPNQVVLLMHDSGDKTDTVKALPSIIQYFKDNGYQFKVIENATPSSFNGIPDKTDTYSNQGESLTTKTTMVNGQPVTEEVSSYKGKGYQYN